MHASLQKFMKFKALLELAKFYLNLIRAPRHPLDQISVTKEALQFVITLYSALYRIFLRILGEINLVLGGGYPRTSPSK